MSEQMMEIKALAWRSFIHSKRTPMVVVAGLMQPLIWLFLFSAIFKNSPMKDLVGGDGSYLAFITPGALLFTAFSGALNGGVPVLFDRELGFLDRLLVAPLKSRYSIIIATGFHIFVMTLLQVVVIMLLTTVMGVRFAGGLGGLLMLFGVLGLVSLLFTTLSLTLAFVLRRHFELISIVMIISLPMVFMSTAFAPMDYMPSWLKLLVALNPITQAVEPLREVYFNASWSFGGTIFSGPLGDFSVATCTGVLIGLNVLMGWMARRVIGKKLK